MRLFLLGAAGYPLLELLYRKRTHYSMAIAGGLSAVLIGHISRMKHRLLLRMLFSGAGITVIEAGCGLIWNRRHKVWDYRQMPMNWKGQICLSFSLLWCVLSAPLMIMLDMKNRTN